MAVEGKKLILEGMPKLAAEDLSVKAVVKWRAAVTGWFKSQGLEEYTISASLPDKVTDEQIRAGLRYVLAGIESQQLRDAISEEAQTGPEAWAFIATGIPTEETSKPFSMNCLTTARWTGQEKRHSPIGLSSKK